MNEYFDHKLRAVNIQVDLTMVIVLDLTKPTTLEAIGLALLPTLQPLVNLSHLTRLHHR